MPRLVYIVDWLPPDYGAIGQYALAESRERARQGDDVVLVGLSSSAPSEQTERLGGGRCTVVRIPASPVDRSDFRRRARWTLQTNLRLLWAARRHVSDADEILFTASPPFLEHLIGPLNLLIRKHVVFRVSDLHPEVMMGQLPRVPRSLELFQRLTVRWRRAMPVIEVLGEDQRRLLVAQGVRPERIVLRRSSSPVAIDPRSSPMPIPAALRGHRVILYSGAVAFPHDYETFVRGYGLHHRRGTGRMALWLNAAGAQAAAFADAVTTAGLPLHRSSPVELADLPRLLVTPDAHLITLKNYYVGLCVPSKTYGCVESGRDILFIGSDQSDVDLLCRQARSDGSYFRVSVGDANGVCAALESLADRAERADRQYSP